jgi:hypothetical protein
VIWVKQRLNGERSREEVKREREEKEILGGGGEIEKRSWEKGRFIEERLEREEIV